MKEHSFVSGQGVGSEPHGKVDRLIEFPLWLQQLMIKRVSSKWQGSTMPRPTSSPKTCQTDVALDYPFQRN
jgi:hypothetical protein